MNRSEFMDYLLEKGECNRFDEHQIDALEQFCFALYDNTELDKPMERIAEQQTKIAEQQAYINHALDNSKEQLISRITKLEKERESKYIKWQEKDNNLKEGQFSEELEKLIYCCAGLSTAYGGDNEWLRHIDIAYQAYVDSEDNK